MHALNYLTLVSCFYASVGWSGTIDEVSRSVVFLRQNVPVVEEINGIRFELWLKFPATNAFIPKQKRILGSGFVVVSSNLCY